MLEIYSSYEQGPSPPLGSNSGLRIWYVIIYLFYYFLLSSLQVKL